MISTTHLVGFAIVAYALIVIPGPSVLFAVGRSLSLGRKSGLVTVLGNTGGTVVPLVLTTAGLGALLAASTWALTAVKLVGAAYLIYLGVQAIRNRKSLLEALDAHHQPAVGSQRVFRQGFIVGMTNPKTALFFAAVLPQFTDPAAGSVPVQIAVFGAIFVLIALVSDSLWALLASSARN
ncbi:MAG: LysE family translocator, partial [Mycobacterium sp.]